MRLFNGQAFLAYTQNKNRNQLGKLEVSLPPMNLLFLCSRNQWRSPTAEAICKNRPGISVKSAGTEPSARVRVNAKLITWADVILVMEQKHKRRITGMFREDIGSRKIVVLDIPDDYQFMDPDLVEELTTRVDALMSRSWEIIL